MKQVYIHQQVLSMKKQTRSEKFVPFTEREVVARGKKTKLITVKVARKSSTLPSLIQKTSSKTVLQLNQALAEVGRFTNIAVKPTLPDFALFSTDMETNSTSSQDVHHIKENLSKSPSSEIPSLGDPTTVGIFFGDGSSEASGDGVSRKRTSYNEEQIAELEAAYYTNPYPTNETRIDLAYRLNVHESKVKIWFQNRRARAKKRDVKPFWMHDPKNFQLPTLSESGDVKTSSPPSIKSRISHENYHQNTSTCSNTLMCYDSASTSSGQTYSKLEPCSTRVDGAGYAGGDGCTDVKKEKDGSDEGNRWNRSKIYTYYNEITGLPSKFPVLGSTTYAKVKSEKFRTLDGPAGVVQHQFYQDQILIDQIHHADDSAAAASGNSFEWQVSSTSDHNNHHVLQQDMNVQLEVVDRSQQQLHVNKFPSIVPSPPPPIQRFFVPQLLGKRNGGFVKTVSAKIGDAAPSFHHAPAFVQATNESMNASSNGNAQAWSYQYLTDAYNSSANYIAMQ